MGATPLQIANALLRNRRLVFGVPFCCAALLVTLGLLSDRMYTSSLSFVPQVANNEMGGAAGIAAQLGIDVPGIDLTQTPDFYAGLIQSDQFQRNLVETPYRVVNKAGDSVNANLVAIYDIRSPSYRRSREMAVEKLGRFMRVGTNLKSGVVRVDMRDMDPALALQMANRTLELVNEFNTQSRRSRAGQERKFVSGRMEESQKELRRAEDALQQYIEHNRGYESSPQLVFEHDRLQRGVMMRHQLYSSLAQQYDQARVQEARTTPVITVVEQPILAGRPDRRFLAYKGVAALMFGTVLAGLIIFGRLMVARNKTVEPAESEEFAVLWKETMNEARSQWHRVRRVVPTRQRATGT
jgi:glutaredoxin